MTRATIPQPFLDEAEKGLIQSFEAALEAGQVPLPSQQERELAQADWTQLVKNTSQRRVGALRSPQGDIK